MVRTNYFLVVYHYLYQAMVRLQLLLGAEKTRYTYWKADVIIVIIDACWAMIVAMWIQLISGYGLFESNLLIKATLVTVGLIWVDRRLMSSKEIRLSYQLEFSSWSKRKRLCCDLGVFVFYLLTLISLYWTLSEVWSIGGWRVINGRA